MRTQRVVWGWFGGLFKVCMGEMDARAGRGGAGGLEKFLGREMEEWREQLGLWEEIERMREVDMRKF